MKPLLQLKISQQLTMTPQLQHAIRLLQLSSMELEQELQTALALNPLLELEEEEKNEEEESVTWDEGERLPTEQEWGGLPNTFHAKQFDLSQQRTVERSLQQYLTWQMELLPLSEKERAIATALIDAIDDAGYLGNTLEEIQACLQNDMAIEPHEMEKVLAHLQQCEPHGVGARDLKECLTLQLNTLPPDTPWVQEAKILIERTGSLECIAKRSYVELTTVFNISQMALLEIIKIITSLDPKPGAKLSAKKSEYIIPDVIVREKNGQFTVELNLDFLPKLRINSEYGSFVSSPRGKGDKEVFRTQLKEAQWLLKSLQARHETLLKVAHCIIDRQTDFLRYGEEMMKSLSLLEVAEKLDLHESTISRVTSQKYILTPRGVFELKFFFSNFVNKHSTSELPITSATAIRALIKNLIANESPEKPYSDLEITQQLAKKAIRISRRTVAKYRESMKIPSSGHRKGLIFNQK